MGVGPEPIFCHEGSLELDHRKLIFENKKNNNKRKGTKERTKVQRSKKK
jgi:hypothetical protein